LRILKAELHCHLEGAASPKLVRRLAKRNHLALPSSLFTEKNEFSWSDFITFLEAYDVASSAIRTPEDYRDVTYEYLIASAIEGVIYTELMASPDHAAASGLGYAGMLEGIVAGINDARAHGIEGRIIMTCVRHLGPDRALSVAKQVAAGPHPYIVGFGMGGDENKYHPADFRRAFQIAVDAGLSCTCHAGEVAGPDSIRAALTHLPLRRIGHGVRAIDDQNLMSQLAEQGIVLEICPSSNIATGVFASYAEHPLKDFRDAGCAITLNSDDPPYFKTTIGREYQIAADHFGFDEAALRDVTHTAISESFAEPELKSRLLARLRS